jgi:hypothetical protein
MPKKKSKTEEDEILKEIADKLKGIKDEESLDGESEKSELEENLDLNTLEFDQFIQPMHLEDIGAPVLERIAGSQPGPIFVGGIPQTPVTATGEEEKSDEFKYVPGQEGNGEPKYIESDSRISREPERVDFARLGREPTEMIPAANQEAFFRRAEASSQIESPTFERTGRVEQIDTGRAGREDPFRKEEIKYEKYKPKTPKSY